MKVFRGLTWAGLWGALGAAAPAAMMVAFMLCQWSLQRTSAFDRQFDLFWLKRDLPGPVVGCSAIFACAGWAAHAPLGAFRFSKSLAMIFAITLPLWFVLGSMHLTPRRLKGVEHPIMYPSEFMVVAGPPILAAAILTIVRTRKAPAGFSPPRQGGDKRM